MVGPLLTLQKGLDRGNEIVRDGAADAAIGELDDIVCWAGLDAAGAQDFAIDANIAEFIDDERQTRPPRVSKK